MEMNFTAFRDAVGKQFARMQKHDLFTVSIDKDAMYAAYQDAFPEGSNPIFRERREHDCTACSQFIRAVGNVVCVIDNQLVSTWDVGTIANEPVYTIVAAKLSALIKRQKIAGLFFHHEPNIGKRFSFDELLTNGTSPKLWEHFHATLDPKFVVIPKKADKTVAEGEDDGSDSAGKRMNEARVSKDMLLRAITEFSDASIEIVLDLIDGDLHRGIEYKHIVLSLKAIKAQYAKLTTDRERELFVWRKSLELPVYDCRIYGSSIGTLLIDLEKGKALEAAVNSFEDKVSAGKHKRSSAPITPTMIKDAEAAATRLGRMPSLPRRHARLDDITVNNVLFADRSARRKMSGSHFEELAASRGAVTGRTLDRVDEVPIAKFISDILPRTVSMEVYFEGKHENNLVSLIAPQDPTAPGLFTWDNNFSWSYAGEVTDAIKERVKRAGGKVDGDLCCRLAWDYRDDLDFHMREPGNGHIYFSNRRQVSANGGVLDLDANGADGQRDDPAENIVYADRRKMCDGIYTLSVNNYCRRDSGEGFTVEIEFDGQVHQFHYDRKLREDQTVEVAQIKYSKTEGFQIIKSIDGTQPSKTVWGISTQQFHRVNAMMLSPNYWDKNTGGEPSDDPANASGQKHFFFMLDGCVNDTTARGFYNAFLMTELRPHRKVFEVLGGKMLVPPSTEQLSGLGFSVTRRNTLLCRVQQQGNVTRTIKIAF